MAENENTQTVDANTDDLDAFDDLFNGRAEETPTEDPVKDLEADDEAEEENAEDADDNSAEDEDVDSGANEDDDSEDQEGDNEEEDEDADPEPKPKGNKKKTFQDRIDELTAARREAERDAAKWQALAEERERNSQSKTEETKETEKETTQSQPDVTDKGKYPLGDLDPQYQADMLDFKLEKRIAELNADREKTDQERAAQARSTALESEWNVKVESANETYDDFQEAVQSLESVFEGVPLERGQLIAETVMRMEKGTDVLYHLAKNPDQVNQLIDSDPVNAAVALGRIEAGFLRTETKPKKVVKKSNAPIPPKTFNKGNKASLNVKPDTDDLDAFEDVFFDRKK